MDESERPIEHMIDEIEGATGGEEISVGSLLDKFESQSLGAVLVIFGLLSGLPVIGAIPGMPDIAAIVVLITVFHSFVGGDQHFWAPHFIRRRTVERQKVTAVLERVRPVGRWVDSLIRKGRLAVLADSRTAKVAILLSTAFLALLMLILSLIPFGATPVAFGYVLFGLALMGRDGLFALGGYALVVVSIAILFAMWSTVFGSG